MKSYMKFMAFAMMAVFSLTFVSCSDDDDEPNSKQLYDVLQINGVNYACYGYRCPVTYTTDWDLSTHSGTISLPCGRLADAQQGEYDFDYMYSINLNGSQDLKKGSKLEDFSPEFTAVDDDYVGGSLAYISGSATITDKKNDTYITVKFENFQFSNGTETYTLNGSVQLDLDED